MSNGMPNWDEWNGLTKEQRDYSLYKVLAELSSREYQRDQTCTNRLMTCNIQFARLEKRKWFDRGVAAATGIVTGLAAALGIKIGP